MTKMRDANTVAGRVKMIADAIGVCGCTAAVDRSDRTIYQWFDPDTETRPDFKQCIALDRAYQEATGKRGPLLDLYEHRLGERAASNGCVVTEHLELSERVGSLATVIKAAIADGIVTEGERIRIINECYRVQGELHDIIDAVTPKATGPVSVPLKGKVA